VQKHTEEENAALQASQAAAKEVSEFEDVQLRKAKKLEEYNAIYKENFEALLSPTEALSAKDQKVHLSKLDAVLKELSADKSLITAFPAVAKKMPSERGAFDSCAMESVNTLLKTNTDSLQSDLDNGDNLKAQKIDAVKQAEATLDTAKENLKASKESMKAATEDLMSRTTETKAALKALTSKITEDEKAAKQLNEQQKGLQKVQSLVSMFEFLLERDVPAQETSKVESMMEDSKMEVTMEESPAPMVEPVQLPVA